jgi:hypothetical protein
MSTMAKHIGKHAHKLAWHRKFHLARAGYFLSIGQERTCFQYLFEMLVQETDGELK